MLRPSSPQVMEAADRAMAVLEPFEPRDQLAAMGWVALSVLGALRDRFEGTSRKRHAFDNLCGATLTWLQREVETLRFTKAH